MKRLSFVLTTAMLICMMIPTTQAASYHYQKIEIVRTEYGDYEIETTTIIYDSMARSNSISADRTYTVKYSGKVVAEVTLSATFDYDGKTTWVTSASGSHTIYDGWKYSNEKITKSGGTASLNAELDHNTHGNITVNVSMTCSPTGQIS